MKSFNKLIWYSVIISCILLLIASAFFDHKYTFYNFVRWFISVSFTYLSFEGIERREYKVLIFFIPVSVLFNPFFTFSFQREVWQLIDILVSIVLVIIFLIRLKKQVIAQHEAKINSEVSD